MRRRWTFVACVVAALVGVGSMAVGWAQQDTNPAMNHPDLFAWKTFIEISRPARNGSNDALWETWATDDDTFPAQGDPAACTGTRLDPRKCPIWPGRKHRRDVLQPITKLMAAGTPTDEQEVVYRNKPAYDYIVSNNLWNRDGLIDAFTRARAGRFTVKFPINAIEAKAIWLPITTAQRSRYHWNFASDGVLYGLAALHIMTKDIPAWFWATFEHVDVAGRCDVIGCHDEFGMTPADVGPAPTAGQRYPAGKLSPALLGMMRHAGLGPEWQFYRLKGTQTEFVDVTGRPTLLGNTRLERGFVGTSSCMTCHARATLNGDGMTLNVFRSRNPRVGNVGAPDPSWYWNPDGSMRMLSLDFVWAFLNVLKQLPPDK